MAHLTTVQADSPAPQDIGTVDVLTVQLDVLTVQLDVLTVEQRAREDRLVRTHLPLVQYLVADMAARVPRYVTRDDLVSAAMCGLAQAARSFDPGRGASFTAFASSRVKGAMVDELRARDWATRSVRAKARAIARTAESLASTLWRQPTLGEVAEAMGTTRQAVEAVNQDVHRALVVNLNALGTDGDAHEVVVLGPPGAEEAMLDKERRAYLVAAVHSLPARLRRVVVGYFVEELPMAVLGKELGVSESRISQICAEAVALLRNAINAQLDPDLVPADSSPRVAKRHDDYYAAVSTFHRFTDRFRAEAACISLDGEAAVA
jgi:RNA polymerase sigma factor for flagellar operon FliA